MTDIPALVRRARRAGTLPPAFEGAARHDASSFDEGELIAGTRHELEHTTVVPIAMQIAMDHLAERPHYYSELYATPRFKPRRSTWVKGAIRHPGKLGGAGFVTRPRSEQRAILDECVDVYGYRSCLGSIMLLERLSSRYPEAQRARLGELHRYLVDAHGDAPRPNPDDGSWSAIAVICQPHPISDLQLTRAQLEELNAETT